MTTRARTCTDCGEAPGGSCLNCQQWLDEVARAERDEELARELEYDRQEERGLDRARGCDE
jgi:hypothetical protein